MTAVVLAWQAALSAEQEAVFGYQLLGPRLPQRFQSQAQSSENAHAALRDTTADALLGAGQTPGATAPDYPGLYPVDTQAAALKLAAKLEDGCTAAWRAYYAQLALLRPDVTTLARRRVAQAALTSSAVRATQWRLLAGSAPATTAFPGI